MQLVGAEKENNVFACCYTQMLTFQEVDQYNSGLSVRQNNDLYSLAD